MDNIYIIDKRLKFNLKCHTNYYKFEKGKIYNAYLEPCSISKDTNYKKCTTVWVSVGGKCGARFSVVGNIYNPYGSYWKNFNNVFYCPIKIERKEKINKLNKRIYGINTKING